MIRSMSKPIEQAIKTKISGAFQPMHLAVKNDSSKHAHHAGLRGATNVTESHFRLTIVSDVFAGKSLPARHRMVYALLNEEIKEKGVHAVQLKTKTPTEWGKDPRDL